MAETADSDLYDVIILGAGLTGLGLARLLTQHAKRPSFLVLEARDRVGGRIHSVETTDGATVEMGATWFFPPFRNMFKMLKELKVELGEQYLKGYVMYESDPNSPPNKSYSTGDDEDMFRIKGGTKQVITALCSTFDQEARVKLGHVVTSISTEKEEARVRVKTQNGSKKELRCRVIVSTLPPQLLAHSVSLSPPLDDNSLNILRTTHTWMGDAAKGAVTFARPFWRDKELAGALYSRPGPFVQMYDQCGHDGKHAAMVGFMDVDESMSQEQRREAVRAQLVRVFGESAGDITDYRDTLWAQERFTTPEGGGARLRHHQNNGHALYQKPVLQGRLIIAGTETSPVSGGYMEGAVNSANHAMSLINNII